MHEAFAAELGHVIREARHRAGLRQDTVAQALQLPPRLYARMERGKLLPSVRVLRDLCVALGVSSEELLHLSAPRPPEDPALLRSLLTRLRALPEERFQEVLALLSTLEGT
jgi:transcriptional regulator with XRE-family HTH domain